MSCCDETQCEFIKKKCSGLAMSCCDETQSDFIKMFRGEQCHGETRLKVNL